MWESKDKVMLMNPRFKEGVESTPVQFVNFIVTDFVNGIAMGHVMGAENHMCAQVEKWFDLTPQQEMRHVELATKAFMEAGIPKAETAELLNLYREVVAKAKPMKPMAEPLEDKTSLYARLGGIVPITMVIDTFVNKLATDPVIGANPHVAKSLSTGKVTAAGLKFLLEQQVAQAAGGPFKYTGRTMKEAHQGLMISEQEWESGAKILMSVLDMYKVPEKEQGELMKVVASLHNDVVGH